MQQDQPKNDARNPNQLGGGQRFLKQNVRGKNSNHDSSAHHSRDYDVSRHRRAGYGPAKQIKIGNFRRANTKTGCPRPTVGAPGQLEYLPGTDHRE